DYDLQGIGQRMTVSPPMASPGPRHPDLAIEPLDMLVRKIGCVAPFTQMLIAWGMVSCCCYQDRISLGDLRRSRLKDIWNNRNFVALRQKMLQGKRFGSIDKTWSLECERGESVCQYCANFDLSDEVSPFRVRSASSFNTIYNEKNIPTSA